MKTDQSTADRIDRLVASSNLSAKLRVLVDDPDVSAHFSTIEAAMVEGLIAAKTSEARDVIAAEIRAWRKVRAVIAALAYSGKHAGIKLEQLTKETTDAT